MIVDFFKIIFFNSQKVITCQMLNYLISIFFLSIFIHVSLIVFVFFWNLCGAKAYAIFDKFYQRL